MPNWITIGITFAISVLIWAILTQVPDEKEIGSKLVAETSKNTPLEPYSTTANAVLETKGSVESGIGSILIKFFTNYPIMFLTIFGSIGVGIYIYSKK